jgi:hypothetical protein
MLSDLHKCLIKGNIYLWACILPNGRTRHDSDKKGAPPALAGIPKTEKGNNMNKILARAVLVGATLLASSQAVHAIPVTYQLQDVTFTDGATASGSFIYDADTRSRGAFQVTTTDGVLPGFTYDGISSGMYLGGGSGPNNFILFANTGRRYLNFSFLQPLGSAPGTYAINAASSYECNNCGTFRMMSGSVTVAGAEVPEPATALLMLPAALGLFAARRRKARAAA